MSRGGPKGGLAPTTPDAATASTRPAALERRGVLDDSRTDPLVNHAPVLARLPAPSIQGRAATAERGGHRLRRITK